MLCGDERDLPATGPAALNPATPRAAVATIGVKMMPTVAPAAPRTRGMGMISKWDGHKHSQRGLDVGPLTRHCRPGKGVFTDLRDIHELEAFYMEEMDSTRPSHDEVAVLLVCAHTLTGAFP